MASKNSFKFSGLVNKKAVGIDNGAENKGVVLITKKQTSELLVLCTVFTDVLLLFLDARRYTLKKTALIKNRRKTFHSIRKTLGSNYYRKDLIEVQLLVLTTIVICLFCSVRYVGQVLFGLVNALETREYFAKEAARSDYTD